MTFALWTPAFTNDVSVIPAEFLNQLRVDINRAVDGNAGGTYAAALTWTGQHTFQELVVMSGSNAGIKYRTGAIADASATCDVSVDIYIASTLATANRTITLRSSTAPVPEAGQVIRFANHISTGVGTFDWIFQREDTTELGRIKETLNNALGFISFVYTASGWEGFEQGGSGLFTNH